MDIARTARVWRVLIAGMIALSRDVRVRCALMVEQTVRCARDVRLRIKVQRQDASDATIRSRRRHNHLRLQIVVSDIHTIRQANMIVSPA